MKFPGSTVLEHFQEGGGLGGGAMALKLQSANIHLFQGLRTVPLQRTALIPTYWRFPVHDAMVHSIGLFAPGRFGG
jgi:hypothetical protein